MLSLSDLITYSCAVFRNASPVLVAACGARIWGSRIASMNKSKRGVSGRLSGWVRHVRVAGQREPHGNIVNDALTFDTPHDAHQSKKEGEPTIFVAFSRSSVQFNLRIRYRNATLSARAQRVSWPRPPQSAYTTVESVHSQPANIPRTRPTITNQDNGPEARTQSRLQPPHFTIRRLMLCSPVCYHPHNWIEYPLYSPMLRGQ